MRTKVALVPLLLLLALAGCGQTPPAKTAKSSSGSESTSTKAPSSTSSPSPSSASTPSPSAGGSTSAPSGAGSVTTKPGPPPDAVGVMIENAPAARPQSGLDKAQVIYEMWAEGGITRYLTYFNLNETATLGPIRSARIYYVHIDKTYGLPLAHAGGNVDALKAIPALHLPNLDGLFAASPFFHRIHTRKAPHNLYTSIASLQKGIKYFHLKDAPLRMWPTGALPSGGQATPEAHVAWFVSSVYTYRTSFVWSGSTYQYEINGKPDVQADGQTVTTPNVIIMTARISPDPDPYTKASIKYHLTSGSGYLLRDDERFPITWTFGQNGFTFALSNGSPALLAPGKVFVQVVPSGGGRAPTFGSTAAAGG